MVQKVIRDRLDAILHWNISLVGGFLGAYAILLHAGNFGSAQTGNLMEMGVELVSMEWFNVLLRLAALVLFGLGVASADGVCPLHRAGSSTHQLCVRYARRIY